MHFIKIKTIHVLHKISFHNTIPHISRGLIGHVITGHSQSVTGCGSQRRHVVVTKRKLM